jgi:hypothetical protein
MVSKTNFQETLVHSPFNHLMLLLDQESFIELNTLLSFGYCGHMAAIETKIYQETGLKLR